MTASYIRGALGVAAMVAAMVFAGATHAEVIKPIKSTRTEIGGAIFKGPDAKKAKEHGTTTIDAITHTSTDGAFQTGMYKSGAMREEIAAAPGYPVEEFLYFLSGSVKLTSSDGSSMVVHAGESVTIPKGWTGVFETKGYTKIYVVYDPSAIKK